MATQVTIACKLPAGLILSHAGRKHKLTGSADKGAVGGFGLTRGVDSDWFNDWVAKHADFEPVAKGLIFANPNLAVARDAATERADTLSGFEGIDPDNPAPGIEQAPITAN